MSSLSNNKYAFVINNDSIFINNNNDAHNAHVKIETKGSVNENDIEFVDCHVKVVDGHLACHTIKDLCGNDVLGISENALDFKNATITNLNLGAGSINASTVASANSYASLDAELDSLHLNKLHVSGHTSNTNQVLVTSNGGDVTFSSDCHRTDLAKLATNGAVDLNTAKTGITSSQASAITANTAKTGITSSQASAITANTAKTGITSSQASAIIANTAKTGITSSEQNAIVANTAKVGITPTQASDITANNAKTGITSSQASAIVANTAKTGITSSQASAIVANTNKTGITSSQASAIVANTNKTGITSSQASAIVANTAKTGISSSQASAITANTAKTGITSSQASAIVANTAKTGITSSQASAITANTAKTGISSGQANAIIANTAKTGITSSQATAITDNTQTISNISSSLNSVNSDIADIETKTNKITVSNSVSLGVETHGNVTLFAGPVGATSYVSNKNGNLTLKGGYDGNYDSGQISLYTNNTERMTISKDGHTTVNISPGYQFDVKRASLSGYNGIRLLNANGNYRNVIFINGSDAGYFQAYDSSNTAKVLLQAGGNSYLTGGRLGIGTTSPGAGLHVTTISSQSVGTAGYLSTSGGTGTYPYGSRNIAIKTENGHIWSTDGYSFIVNSDRRIKENIIEVNDNSALNKVRDISCCWYNYKDKIKRGNQRALGFIAQQVKEHIPEAISIQKSVIPNKLKLIHTSWDETKMSSNDLQDVSGIKYRFYVNNDISDNEKMVELVGDENNCFIFKEKWENVFCYGKEVDDFHTLDKQKLFALNFSATQELDRLVQSLTDRIKVLEEKLE